MKHCSKCGAEMSDESIFCASCGTKSEIATSENTESVSEQGKTAGEQTDNSVRKPAQYNLNGQPVQQNEQPPQKPQAKAPSDSRAPAANSINTLYDVEKAKKKKESEANKKQVENAAYNTEPVVPNQPQGKKKKKNSDVMPSGAKKKEIFDPYKTMPPADSQYSVLKIGITAFSIFMFMIPGLGILYAVILALSSKKRNLKNLGAGYLSFIAIVAIILAIAYILLNAFAPKVLNIIFGTLGSIFKSITAGFGELFGK